MAKEPCQLRADWIRRQFQNRFTHVLVDEFQDNSIVQLRILLALDSLRLTLVGDDDQSIYGFRGSLPNAFRVMREHLTQKDIMRDVATDCVRFTLEQSYRCSPKILEKAHELIQNNPDREGKRLISAKPDGEAVHLDSDADDVNEEANVVVRRLKELVQPSDGSSSKVASYSDCAVLLRAFKRRRLDKMFQESFIKSKIPFEVYGANSILKSKEFKDVFAYLSLCIDRNDDAAFKTILNRPSRPSLGDSTKMVREIEKRQVSLSVQERLLLMGIWEPNRPKVLAKLLRCDRRAGHSGSNPAGGHNYQ